MTDKRESTRGMFGLLGVGIAVCCGLPVLLGAGIAIGAAGLALGSSLVIAAGIAITVWAWRRHQAAQHCRRPQPPRQVNAAPHADHLR